MGNKASRNRGRRLDGAQAVNPGKSDSETNNNSSPKGKNNGKKGKKDASNPSPPRSPPQVTNGTSASSSPSQGSALDEAEIDSFLKHLSTYHHANREILSAAVVAVQMGFSFQDITRTLDLLAANNESLDMELFLEALVAGAARASDGTNDGGLFVRASAGATPLGELSRAVAERFSMLSGSQQKEIVNIAAEVQSMGFSQIEIANIISGMTLPPKTTDELIDAILAARSTSDAGGREGVPPTPRTRAVKKQEAIWNSVQSVNLTILEQEFLQLDDVYRHAERLLSFAERRDIYISKIRFLNPHSTFEALINVVTGSNRLTFDPNMPVESAMYSVLRMSPLDLRKTINVHFAGQEGLDFGGVSRGFLDALSGAVNQGMLPYIQFHQKSGMGWPGPESVGEPGAQGFYRTIGRCVGLALNNTDQGLTFPVKLAMPFFRILVGQRLTIEHLKEVDEDFVNHLRSLLTYADNPDDLGLSFSISRIIPDANDNTSIGSDTDVTSENFEEYLKAQVLWRLGGGFTDLLEHFIRGVNDVVPLPLLHIFSPQELRLLVCGVSTIDPAEIIASSIYKQFDIRNKKHRNTKEWFAWAIMQLTQDELRMFAEFLTGTSTLPAGGFRALNPSFTITLLIEGVTKEHLPCSSTCTNELHLPCVYPNKNWLLNKLRQALPASGYHLH